MFRTLAKRCGKRNLFQRAICRWTNSETFSTANWMRLMQSYTVIVSNEATGDLDEIANYIATVFRSASGHNFVNRILGQIQALSYSAGTYRDSPYAMVKLIHPHAKTMNIINHRWTVVFHINGEYVVVDRIIRSSRIAF